MKTETLKEELSRVANFWLLRALDKKNGGIYGEISSRGEVIPHADKGAVLHFRCLWFFSEMGLFSPDSRFAQAADDLYAFIQDHFIDNEDGGVYWSLHENGRPANMRKQSFAHAFYIYALLSYYKLTRKQEVLNQAHSMYDLIETKTFQPDTSFHISASDKQWSPLQHMGFGEGDIHAEYTLDTELHILEVYTELYKLSPSPKLADSIRACLKAFETGFLDQKSGFLHTHLNGNLQSKSSVALFGHNAECAWLIQDALAALADKKLQKTWMPLLLRMLYTLEKSGISKEGRLLEGTDRKSGEILEDSIWWMQCEGVIGMMLGYHLTRDKDWIDRSEHLLDYIFMNHVDNDSGEWQWFTLRDRLIRKEIGVVNEWKGPYHNGRMLMKAIAFKETS